MRAGFTLLTAGLVGAVCAQGVITRLNGGNSYFTYDGDIQLVLDAAEAAAGVDTIILGGGQYIIDDNLFITSPVVMIGSGIRPDSASAYPTRTVISAENFKYVNIMENADGTELHGIVFRGSVGVRVGTSLATSDADDLRFIRCEFQYLYLGWSSNGSLADDPYVEHCVIDDLDINQSTDPIISNSVITNIFGAIAGSNCIVQRCLFLNETLSGNVNVSYQNNIFARALGTAWNISEASTFINNLFVGNAAGFSHAFTGAAVDGGGNVDEQPMHGNLGAFPNLVDDNTNYTTFSYLKDYHPAAAYANMGIYSGTAPWKDGSLPFNPHWTELTSPQNTTVNGTLQGVTIRASAQEN